MRGVVIHPIDTLTLPRQPPSDSTMVSQHDTKTRAPLGKLRGKMGKKEWMAAGMIPVVAGLGTLLGTVKTEKQQKTRR